VPLAPFTDLLAAARRAGSAVAAFSVYDAESLVGVLRAAAGRPLIVLISSQVVAEPGGDLVVAGMLAMAERAPSPVALQLDHARDLDVIAAGCELGLGAVMADGSGLPYDENVAFVLAARALAAPRGIAVEAELGHLAGEEEVALAVDPGPLTDPAAAERFARETGADCLAVAIGNVHGIYRGAPHLDLEHLRAIAARVAVPLSLHGGSGLAASAVAGAVAGGMTKVNFNTELRQAYLARTADELPGARDGARLLALHRAQADAVAAVAAERFAVLSA
jgi:tagatose 1,6-diphosphate aldolase GatY/KbaY